MIFLTVYCIQQSLFFIVSLFSLFICLSTLFLYRSLVLYSKQLADINYIHGQRNAIDSRLAEISEMYSMMQMLNHDIRKHMQVTETMLSKNEIEDLTPLEGMVDLQKLSAAWQRVRRNKPAAGVDNITWQQFDENSRGELKQLQIELIEME